MILDITNIFFAILNWFFSIIISSYIKFDFTILRNLYLYKKGNWNDRDIVLPRAAENIMDSTCDQLGSFKENGTLIFAIGNWANLFWLYNEESRHWEFNTIFRTSES